MTRKISIPLSFSKGVILHVLTIAVIHLGLVHTDDRLALQEIARQLDVSEELGEKMSVSRSVVMNTFILYSDAKMYTYYLCSFRAEQNETLCLVYYPVEFPPQFLVIFLDGRLRKLQLQC